MRNCQAMFPNDQEVGFASGCSGFKSWNLTLKTSWIWLKLSRIDFDYALSMTTWLFRDRFALMWIVTFNYGLTIFSLTLDKEGLNLFFLEYMTSCRVEHLNWVKRQQSRIQQSPTLDKFIDLFFHESLLIFWRTCLERLSRGRGRSTAHRRDAVPKANIIISETILVITGVVKKRSIAIINGRELQKKKAMEQWA